MRTGIRLNEFLRERREHAGHSLEGLAILLKMPVERLTAYELGTEPIPLDELWAISNGLHLNPDELIELFECLPQGELHE